MKDSLRTNLLKYGCTTLVGLGIACLVIYGQTGFFALKELDSRNLYMVLCDAFTIPGVLILLTGCLMAVGNQGAFDGVGYALSVAAKMLIPGGRASVERYSDYRERKHEKKGGRFGFLLVDGGCFLAVALVFLVLYQTQV